MTETTLSKIAKIVFVIGLIAFLLKEQSIYAVNIIRDLIINNLLIVVVFVIIILVWLIKLKGGNKEQVPAMLEWI